MGKSRVLSFVVVFVMLATIVLGTSLFSTTVKANNVLPPQNLMASPMAETDTTITVIWDKPTDYSNVASYDVYKNGVLLGNTTKLFYMATGLNPSTSYNFTVKAKAADGTASVDSNTLTKSTMATPTDINITSYGAVGDGVTLNTTAIQNAINACPSGGRVVIPSGTFLSGAIFLKSNMTLYLASGAILQGSTNASDYPYGYTRTLQTTEAQSYASLVNVATVNHGTNYTNIAIRGSGKIRGGGAALKAAMGNGNNRQTLVLYQHVTNMCIQGVTFENPAAWMVYGSYNSNVSLFGNSCYSANMGYPENDGLDIVSSNYVYVFDNYLNTGDDGVAFGAGWNQPGVDVGVACHDNRVFNNTFYHTGSAGVTWGSGTSGGLENMVVEDNTMDGCLFPISFRTNQWRGGYVRNITIRDCNIINTSNSNPFGTTDAGVKVWCTFGSLPSDPAIIPTQIYGINISNLIVDKGPIGIDIIGFSDISKLHDVNFSNCQIKNSSTAISVTGCTNFTFTDCTLTGNSTNYIKSNTSNVQFVNCNPAGQSDAPTPSGSNLALNKMVSASSTLENADWGITKAVNGIRNSTAGDYGYTSDSNKTVNHTEWTTIDLGSSFSVNRVDLYGRTDSGNVGVCFPIDFTIKTSTDNTNWTTAVTQTNYPQPDTNTQAFMFTDQNARYIKIEGTNLRTSNGNYRMQLAEIEAYGDGGVTPTPTPSPITRYECESLTETVSSGDSHGSTADVNCSNGYYDNGILNTVNDYVEFTVPVSATGTYKVVVGEKTAGSGGQSQLGIDGVNQGAVFDNYSAAIAYSSVDLGNVTFSTTGNKAFRFKVTGKNTSSTGYNLRLDYIELQRQ